MERKPTVEEVIKTYFEEHRNEWRFGGQLEDLLRTIKGTKGETTSRILRFMANDGTLEVAYEDTGHGKPNVKYRLLQEVKQNALWKD